MILPELAASIRVKAHTDRCVCAGDIQNCKALKGVTDAVRA